MKKQVLVAIKGTLVSFHAKFEGPNLKNDFVMAVFMISFNFKISRFLDFFPGDFANLNIFQKFQCPAS